MGNHRHTHQYHAENKASNISFQILHTNVDGENAAAMQNIETNICLLTNTDENIPNISYYKMPMDDYDECLLHDCNGFMDYDENDAIDYDNDESVNNNIIELNIIDDDDGIKKEFFTKHAYRIQTKKLSLMT